MEDVFTIIGKLYIDSYNSQKIIELLQQQLKDKDKTIEELQNSKVQDG